MKTNIRLTAVFQPAEEGGFVGYVEEVPGINTQGETLDEVKSNLTEAIELFFETQRMLSEKELEGKEFIRERIEMV
ncbi:MAG TPA: type II toxin-antitoxin system HicB family antitoxin [Chitinophagales bacterium]|nr:type II toxin-antitoxin system HicB family antitoxin [Chitinophagales bacterium]